MREVVYLLQEKVPDEERVPDWKREECDQRFLLRKISEEQKYPRAAQRKVDEIGELISGNGPGDFGEKLSAGGLHPSKEFLYAAERCEGASKNGASMPTAQQYVLEALEHLHARREKERKEAFKEAYEGGRMELAYLTKAQLIRKICSMEGGPMGAEKSISQPPPSPRSSTPPTPKTPSIPSSSPSALKLPPAKAPSTPSATKSTNTPDTPKTPGVPEASSTPTSGPAEGLNETSPKRLRVSETPPLFPSNPNSPSA